MKGQKEEEKRGRKKNVSYLYRGISVQFKTKP